MITDNGTNFGGAEGELSEEKKIKKSTLNRGVVWKFNPPLARHLNSLHEVLIKAAGRSMANVLSNADLTNEELMAAMVGAEALMNSRPITYQSSNEDDPEPLTPDHFLFNQFGGQLASESVNTEPYYPRVR